MRVWLRAPARARIVRARIQNTGLQRRILIVHSSLPCHDYVRTAHQGAPERQLVPERSKSIRSKHRRMVHRSNSFSRLACRNASLEDKCMPRLNGAKPSAAKCRQIGKWNSTTPSTNVLRNHLHSSNCWFRTLLRCKLHQHLTKPVATHLHPIGLANAAAPV